MSATNPWDNTSGSGGKLAPLNKETASNKAEKKKGALEVKTLDADTEKPIPGARVVAEGPGAARPAATTGPTGSAQFPSLDPGSYSISCSKADYNTSALKASVQPAQTSSVTAHMARVGTYIEIQVQDDAGKPVVGLKCVVTDSDGKRHEIETKAQGVARLEGIHKGTCKVTFPDVHPSRW